jgi:hypothetical protein
MREAKELTVTDDEDILAHRILRTEARRMAAAIRQIEAESPNRFGEATSVIRQVAAGDDVAPDDLTAALASLRLALRDSKASSGGHVPPKPKHP